MVKASHAVPISSSTRLKRAQSVQDRANDRTRLPQSRGDHCGYGLCTVQRNPLHALSNSFLNHFLEPTAKRLVLVSKNGGE